MTRHESGFATHPPRDSFCLTGRTELRPRTGVGKAKADLCCHRGSSPERPVSRIPTGTGAARDGQRQRRPSESETGTGPNRALRQATGGRASGHRPEAGTTVQAKGTGGVRAYHEPEPPAASGRRCAAAAVPHRIGRRRMSDRRTAKWALTSASANPARGDTERRRRRGSAPIMIPGPGNRDLSRLAPGMGPSCSARTGIRPAFHNRALPVSSPLHPVAHPVAAAPRPAAPV